jgi:hypothetical protein
MSFTEAELMFACDGCGAERVARRLRTGLRAYLCPRCSQFHIGHLPRRIIAGLVTRDVVYRRAA